MTAVFAKRSVNNLAAVVLGLVAFAAPTFSPSIARADCEFKDARFVRSDVGGRPMSYLIGKHFCAPDHSLTESTRPSTNCIGRYPVTPTGSRYYGAAIDPLGIAPPIIADGHDYGWVNDPAASAPAWIEFRGVGRFERQCLPSD